MTNGIVVVLGPTGKNFAAGMSGGFAYVLDESGEFSATLCNRSMVDVDPLDAKDEETVRTLVEKHFEYTASPRARLILDQWQQFVKKFVKVFPHDYKRVLSNASNVASKNKTAAAVVEEVSRG
jgi:glutamate synthase domain-containing protein 3